MKGKHSYYTYITVVSLLYCYESWKNPAETKNETLCLIRRIMSLVQLWQPMPVWFFCWFIDNISGSFSAWFFSRGFQSADFSCMLPALHSLRTHVLRMPQMLELTAGPWQVETWHRMCNYIYLSTYGVVCIYSSKTYMYKKWNICFMHILSPYWWKFYWRHFSVSAIFLSINWFCFFHFQLQF